MRQLRLEIHILLTEDSVLKNLKTSSGWGHGRRMLPFIICSFKHILRMYLKTKIFPIRWKIQIYSNPSCLISQGKPRPRNAQSLVPNQPVSILLGVPFSKQFTRMRDWLVQGHTPNRETSHGSPRLYPLPVAALEILTLTVHTIILLINEIWEFKVLK